MSYLTIPYPKWELIPHQKKRGERENRKYRKIRGKKKKKKKSAGSVYSN